MTPVIEIQNSKELPVTHLWATAWELADALPVYLNKFGRAPSVCWQLGNMRFFPVHMVCPVCYVRVDTFGVCGGCAG